MMPYSPDKPEDIIPDSDFINRIDGEGDGDGDGEGEGDGDGDEGDGDGGEGDGEGDGEGGIISCPTPPIFVC